MFSKRAWYVANFVPKCLVTGEAGIPWAREILIRYGDREDVRSSLHANFGTEFWSGPATTHHEGRKRSLEEIRKTERHPRVRRWLDEAIESLTFRIEQEKIREEREF